MVGIWRGVGAPTVSVGSHTIGTCATALRSDLSLSENASATELRSDFGFSE